MKYSVSSYSIRPTLKQYCIDGDNGEILAWVEDICCDRPRTQLITYSGGDIGVERSIMVNCAVPFNKDDPQESIDRIKRLAMLK